MRVDVGREVRELGGAGALDLRGEIAGGDGAGGGAGAAKRAADPLEAGETHDEQAGRRTWRRCPSDQRERCGLGGLLVVLRGAQVDALLARCAVPRSARSCSESAVRPGSVAMR